MCLLLVLETVIASLGHTALETPALSWLLVLISVTYFGFVVVAVIYFTSQHFRVAPRRLARDTVLSITFTILAFAVFHRNAGITLTGDCPAPYTPVDALYFSAVTFSTLGYGDFRPCPEAVARLVAAFQAIFGNLHLGLIVGAAFFFAQDQGVSPEASRRPAEERNTRASERSRDEVQDTADDDHG